MVEEKDLSRMKVDSIHKLYESNQQLIYVSDRKVAALLLVNGVLISLSATWSLKEYSVLTKIVILLAIVLAALSTVMYLLAIMPRVSKWASESILYYKGILRLTNNEYASKMKEMSEEDLIKDYLDTIYSLSSIQMTKNRYLKCGKTDLS